MSDDEGILVRGPDGILARRNCQGVWQAVRQSEVFGRLAGKGC